LVDQSVERIIVERTPLGAGVLREMARVIAPHGTVVLRHVPLVGTDRHRLACEILRGQTTCVLRRLGGALVQETTILVADPSPAAECLVAAESGS
jgi:hypothetical protein